MATFRITGPDGATYNVTAPDGASDADVMAYVQKNAAPKANADSALGGTLPFLGFDTGIKIPPSVEAGLVGAGKAMTRVGQGIRQLMPGSNDKLDAQVADENKRYDALAAQHPVATTVGEIAPYLAVPGGPLAMGAASAVEYGTPMERGTRAALGAAGAQAGKLIGRAFGPASMAPKPGLASEFFADAPNKWKIPLTVGQATQSRPAQIAESVLSNLPFGGAVNKARDASFQQFNRAVGEQFGADTTKITPELLGESQGRIGKAIGSIAERNTLVPDMPLVQGIAAVQTRASKNLVSDQAKIVDNWVQELLSKQDPVTGGIPGTNYRAWRSELGKQAKSEGGTLGNVLGDLKKVVEKGMDRSITPSDSAAWKLANRQYFNVEQVADASKATPGELSPTQLLASINRNQPNARFGAGNDLAELAQWAKQMLPDKIPNSGTAQRALYQKMLTNPIAAGGGLLGAGYGADQMGVNPMYAIPAAAIPFLSARALAGKPASDLSKKLLEKLGGAGLLSLAP